MRLYACLPLILAAACATAGSDPVEDPETVAPIGAPVAGQLVRPDAAPPPADASPPDATPPQPDAEPTAPTGPVMVPGIPTPRLAPPEGTRCGGDDETPIQPDDTGGDAPSDERPLTDEEHGGLPKVETFSDVQDFGADFALRSGRPTATDRDGDCLSDEEEALAGTNPDKADTDGDGWYDGPCNQRVKLFISRVYARDEQEDIGDDELYFIVDDIRYPDGDLDDSWDFNDGDAKNLNILVATRTRGVATPHFAKVALEGWEDDFEVFNTWSPDDLLLKDTIDLGAFADGDTFTRRFVDQEDDDYDYEITYRVVVEKFADPNPLANEDSDRDGIRESDEAAVSRDLGGIADPERTDIFVEVDAMPEHGLSTPGKRQVMTQYHRHGLNLVVMRDEQLTDDGCLTIPEARALYRDHFGKKGFGAFRYAVMASEIWNDRSGVAWGDMFLVDDSTWWIDNWIAPQAATFIHELGHTMGLVQDEFRLIDTVGWPSYHSAMNYLYQATTVDYSGEGSGGDSNDFNDWANLDARYGLRWSFALTTDNDAGICN